MQLREELEAAQWALDQVQGVDAHELAWAVGVHPEDLTRWTPRATLTEALQAMYGLTRGRALTAALLVRLQGVC